MVELELINYGNYYVKQDLLGELSNEVLNYHINLEKSYYSVPYQLVNKKVEVWFSNKIVYIYYEGKKVATHPKSSKKGKYFTLSEHMASAHKKYLESNIYCFSILLNLSINIFILYFTLFNI